ncbi:NADH dehydrogenase subunit 5 (mitochondrion) [Odobenus rosmarus rosmarus]|uniref:NADH-ubiquinone oxidoreductase chain 5 n=2 Tax=Odobenus rosmarus TaxID=9707 RepID=A0A2U3UYF1_ODORO|nr:NADH dehydrogenase subunit 5 [Odobenus rosmarus rosmarus]CAD21716.1 NADH dehydrogenase subunit 5 [Odobenus rosmarus rosmarus]
MNLFTSSVITTLLMLTMPIMLASTSIYKSKLYPEYVKTTTSYAFVISTVPMMMFIYSGQEMIISNWHWMTIQSVKLSLSFKLDHFSMIFMPVALFITWSIMEFSMWYMNSDPYINKFFKYLLMFLVTMMILVTANNLFQLFIGWEGVGIMSFLLIGWWYGRSDANTAALQAILYNRIGDVGLIMAMAWFLTNLNTWDLQQIFMADHNNLNMPLLGLLLAAAGKSAQFGLHPWLPSAMEGPTPVSALLHSSTMVVAGVFLLIRFHPLIEQSAMTQTAILCLGATTTLFTAICALTQNDIKKIIAFSTSSQLGLMMVTIGINQPYLAFLHICTHAFFKAMLFMCSGSIIHSLNDEQHIRKMGGLFKMLPLTTTSLVVGSLALTGMPFLTGFYSKDPIIETANTSYTNAWALMLTLTATSMTAAYSTRIMFFTLLGQPRSNPTVMSSENNPLLINSIKRLLVGSIFAGYLMFYSIPPTTVPQTTMPHYLKLTALVVTLLGFIVALELTTTSHKLKFKYTSNLFKFSSLLGYFPAIIHRFMPSIGLSTSQKLAFTLMDSTWLENVLPKSISYFHMKSSTIISNQKGLIKLYFLSFMITLALALTMIKYHG